MFTFLLFCNNSAFAATATSQPGTADDPVVTKSYVDQQIQNALSGKTPSTPSTTTPSTPSTTPAAPADTSYKIVDVKPGQKLMAASGAEFIVRAGKAVIISDAANGVADLTGGQDLTDGTAIYTNHLLLFPREGRGITTQDGQKYGLVVMVRGGYTIQ
ncbi:hypothetical protein [Paenibacillus lacisoli]|uniref:hypothetical protein n=1 Tax=Paenibacillus lacisoli TaxID=3064525 RepID=UPI00272D73CC|nr:hypothetical protein [Paenibacillus sp. JX-17]